MGFKPVANPPHGVDIARPLCFELGTQSVNVAVHRMFIAVMAVSPDLVQQLGTAENRSWMGNEKPYR